MLKITLLEMLIRSIPEGIIYAFSIYVFSNTTINRKYMLITGILIGLSAYFVRLMPISFGVHTIISIIIIIILAVKLNKINILRSISSSLISIIILSVCDFVNFFVLVNIFNVPVAKMLSDPIIKTLLGLPSLVLFLIIVYMFYKIRYLRSRSS